MSGASRHGKAGKAWSGRDRWVAVWRGMVWQVWQGVACLVVVMHGKARQVWLVLAGRGRA